MNRAVIGVGSNIEPEYYIPRAKELLADEVTILAASRFVRTKAIGPEAAPDYLNGAWLITSPDDQDTLKERLKGIESRLGRSRNSQKYAPRCIDLDIIVFNNWIVDDDYHERNFVREAVLELLPEAPHDIRG